MSNRKNHELKLDRAKEHLEALKEEMTAFRNSQPIKLSREEDEKRGLYRVRFEVKEPSWRTALIVGDFAYCLRSSLDQLAWQMALLNTKKRPGYQTCFPIFGEESPKFFKCVEGIPQSAVAIIRTLQPYVDTKGHTTNLLWKLHKLCIIDKHQRIAVHSHAADINFPHFPRQFAGLVQSDPAGPTVTVPLFLKPHMQHDPIAGINIVFGDTNIDFAVTVAELSQILDLIGSDILPRFESFLRP